MDKKLSLDVRSVWYNEIVIIIYTILGFMRALILWMTPCGRRSLVAENMALRHQGRRTQIVYF